ncbi:MAG: KamA family radical SAM protein [bacterium]|nr:KamA family radical SAM protein [bacterium]
MQNNSAPGGLKFSISNHIKRLAKSSPAVRREFYPSDAEYKCTVNSYDDPLIEDEHQVIKGMVYKYTGRVLILLTMSCAAYCRFCTRRRRVSEITGGLVTRSDISKMEQFLLAHGEINELIFSGGDPLTAPDLLIYSLKKLSKLTQIKIIRIHTRIPVSNPKLLNLPAGRHGFKLLNLIKLIKQPVYVSVHFEHPDELTPETIVAVNKLRKAGAILLSQSVFLKGVNDDYKILFELFTKLSEFGIRPYYIYRCDPVKGIEHFIVDFEKEIEIMTKLRATLSGIACPTYVIDSPNGAGKIPVPLNFWSFNPKSFRDYNNKEIIV